MLPSPGGMGPPVQDLPASQPTAGLGTDLPGVEREFTIEARTQKQIVTRRFLRHRGALSGMVALAFIVLLALTSIGAFGLPGWWDKSYADPGTVVNAGRMTLDLLPPFVDGDWLAWGEYPFGQDDVGRDYFARTMRGTQQSLTIALIVGLVSTVCGVVIGAIAGYFRGWLDSALMRLTDVVITIPQLLIAAVIGRMAGSVGVFALAFFLGLLVWVNLARLVRGEFLWLREKEFVEAARALGAGDRRIMIRHIIPNTVGIIIVNATLTISLAILLETSLSYLGLGVQAPDTSLGLMISDYQSAFQTRPWLFWWPGLFIVGIALSVNFIGDGLRDAFDPKQTRVRA